MDLELIFQILRKLNRAIQNYLQILLILGFDQTLPSQLAKQFTRQTADSKIGKKHKTKGQLISKCPYEKSVWTKYQRKYFCTGSLLLQG